MSIRVGIDVYVGYCPDKYCATLKARSARASIGTVLAGPYPPGEHGRHRFLEPYWRVAIDGVNFLAGQSLLTPIDDAPEGVERERAETA